MREQMTDKEYVRANGGVCPYCGSADLDWGGFDFEGEYFFQKVVCQACDKEWGDRYIMNGYVPGR